jgi:hypothetical protein
VTPVKSHKLPEWLKALLGVRGPQATFQDTQHCDEARNAPITGVSLPLRSDHQLMGGTGGFDRSFGQRCMCEGAFRRAGWGFGELGKPLAAAKDVCHVTPLGQNFPNKISTSSLPPFSLSRSLNLQTTEI